MLDAIWQKLRNIIIVITLYYNKGNLGQKVSNIKLVMAKLHVIQDQFIVRF